MTFAFVHLSDIHFGQEKGGQILINDDAKSKLLEDVKHVFETVLSTRAAGLIVTGDIAYAGKAKEYETAAKWLDEVARAAGCSITDVQVVPGNHDIDRNEISATCEFMLKEIKEKGEAALDKFLADADERALLYRRFKNFIPFADGYRCTLDQEGGQDADRLVHLAPGRSIRFVRLNSALACGEKDDEGTLLLGARQRIMHEKAGEELIVLSHHPLNWFQDGEDAGKFIRSRARLLITGHEHNPSVTPEPVEEGCDILNIAAGATVPPKADAVYTYNYNVIEFEWDETDDKLIVEVHPRTWLDAKKRFEAHEGMLKGSKLQFALACPNFRKAPRVDPTPPKPAEQKAHEEDDTVVIPPSTDGEGPTGEVVTPDPHALIVLRFFRDMSAEQRLALLIEMEALPEGWSSGLSHAHERVALESIIKKGRQEELSQKLQLMLK